MTGAALDEAEVVRALQEGMEFAWDLVSLDGSDPRLSSEALARAALASLQDAGFRVVRNSNQNRNHNEIG